METGSFGSTDWFDFMAGAKNRPTQSEAKKAEESNTPNPARLQHFSDHDLEDVIQESFGVTADSTGMHQNGRSLVDER